MLYPLFQELNVGGSISAGNSSHHCSPGQIRSTQLIMIEKSAGDLSDSIKALDRRQSFFRNSLF